MIKAIVSIPIVLFIGFLSGICISWGVNAKLNPFIVVPPYMLVMMIGLVIGAIITAKIP